MKKRRKIAGCLAAALLLGTAWPGFVEAAEEEIPSLTIWVSAASEYPVRMTCYSYYMAAQMASLGENAGETPELSWNFVDKSYLTKEQLGEELTAAIQAGEGPDLIYLDACSGVDIPKAMEEGWFLEIEIPDRINNTPAEYAPGILEAGQYQGKQYLLPMFAQYPIVFGEKGDLEEAGIYPTETGQDLEEFLQNLLDASEKTGKKIFEDASAVDWIESYCLPEEGETETNDLNTLLEEVRLRSGERSDFFSPQEALSTGECLLSGCSLTDKIRMSHNLSLLDPEEVVFLNLPSWDGEIRPVISQSFAVNANTAYPEEAKAFVKGAAGAVSKAYINGFPAVRDGNAWRNQLDSLSILTSCLYLDEYASRSADISQTSGCSRSLLSCIKEAEGSALFEKRDAEDTPTEEESGEKEVITVAFYNYGLEEADARYRWLKSAAEEMESENLHIQLMPMATIGLVLEAEQMELVHAGPDIILETADPMNGQGLARWYADLSKLSKESGLPLAEIDGEPKGLVYGIRKNKELQESFLISEASLHKEEALAFCLSAMENSLYQETMEELGLTPVM